MKQFKNKKEMFLWIWDNRPHVSELTGKSLLYPNSPKFVWQFAHVLSCGAYPSFALNPENIILVLPEEHENQEKFDLFHEKKDILKQEYYRTYYGKEFD